MYEFTAECIGIWSLTPPKPRQIQVYIYIYRGSAAIWVLPSGNNFVKHKSLKFIIFYNQLVTFSLSLLAIQAFHYSDYFVGKK